MVRHVAVDLAGELDEARVVVERLELPREVERIDRDAVAAEPGPGKNGMKPNGFVAAASMTSQTSKPSLRHMIAISLTRPMFTLRKVFSRSFTISAASGLETGTTRSTAVE